jgi:hypothetical protein
MYTKQRIAVDVKGNRVEITESQDSKYTVRDDGSYKYFDPPKFFDADGKRLIPEGKGFFRSMYGFRYQLVD